MTGTVPVILLKGLTKHFGRVRALDGLDLTVLPGEVHGFLGPNGAGKSTTIRVLLGLMKATSGHAELFGRDPWHDAPRLHRRLAYVAGDVALWPGLTGGQCLDVLGSTHGAVDERRRAGLVEQFQLDPTKKVRDYSKGNRQKVALIAALAADAELLVLDEPTSGLDPLMEQAFQQCVRDRREHGVTVLLSSHTAGTPTRDAIVVASVVEMVHLATLVGIAKAVLRDGLGYVQSRTRTFSHGAADTVRQDPQVLQLLGELSSKVAGIETIFRAIPPVLAEHLAAHAREEELPAAQVDALYAQVYQAQQVIAPVTLEVATKIFEVGGASATSQIRALDRHWRNARVLASHNPLIYRARILGDYVVNGISPERNYTVGQAQS